MTLSPIAITRRLGLEPHEGRLLLLMGALVGTLLCAYTLAKVLRDALFLTEFGAVTLPYMYIGVALLSAAFVWLESLFSRVLTREVSVRISQLAAIGFSVAAAIALPLEKHWTTALFYLWTGSQAMMLLPHFWLLALDVWDSRRARRIFPILTGFGLIGGLVGGGMAAWLTPIVQRVGLMWALTGLLLVAHALTWVVQSHRAHHPGHVEAVGSKASFWEIIRRSHYIKVLAAGLALSVVVSTLVDFQFKFLIQEAYPDPHALTQFLGKFYIGLNVLALLFQFGASGWLLQRLGLGASTGLQPTTVILFASMTALSMGWWAVVAMRWIQGVVFQTLGKSSSEIYFAAIRPIERRLVKPAIDILVERWSDAAAGILLLLALKVFHAPIVVIAGATAVLATAWLVVLLRLDKEYGRAFQEMLSSRWIEPEADAETIRLPSVRKALLEALTQQDVRRIVLALRLAERSPDADIGRAVRDCLRHASPVVRAAAIQAMEAKRMPDREGEVEELLRDPEAPVRRAAVGYRLSRSREPQRFARDLLDGDDPDLLQDALDALWDRPAEARGVITASWVEARLATGTREDQLLAARALGLLAGPASVTALTSLLTNPDLDVQRTALHSAARQPSRELLNVLLPLLRLPELNLEARLAIAAIGDAAVPELQRLLDSDGDPRGQLIAARTLAQIARPRAMAALMTLVRSQDRTRRHLGLRSLARSRGLLSRPVLPRSLAHRLFLRELRDYRGFVAPALGLEKNAAPEIRLLAESYQESANMALERALLALACWYDPRPLFGAFHRLKSRNLDVVAPALEYLGQVLPRATFRPLEGLFESNLTGSSDDVADQEKQIQWIRTAFESGDMWLRACAVRSARHVPGFDLGLLTPSENEPPLVRSELDALAGGRLPAGPVVNVEVLA